MKLFFNDTENTQLGLAGTGATFGFFLEPPIGLDGDLDHVADKVPRSDYSRDIAGYHDRKIFGFQGYLVGSDPTDLRLKKKQLAGKLNSIFTFTLQDDVVNNDGTLDLIAEYEFTGRVITAEVNDDSRTRRTRYRLQIFTEDPFIYSTTEVSQSLNITEVGFTYPKIYPHIYAGQGGNAITVQNIGTAPIYPSITIDGPLRDLIITGATGESFIYAAALQEGQQLILDPSDRNLIKATIDGENVEENTNFVFDVFLLSPGDNPFSFFADEVGPTTQATITFKPGYIGI